MKLECSIQKTPLRTSLSNSQVVLNADMGVVVAGPESCQDVMSVTPRSQGLLQVMSVTYDLILAVVTVLSQIQR